MQELINSLNLLLEEVDQTRKRLDLKKEFSKKRRSEDDSTEVVKEPKRKKKNKNPLLRKLEDIRELEASLDDLEKLIKKLDKQSKEKFTTD